jgi:hypothetical protein
MQRNLRYFREPSSPRHLVASTVALAFGGWLVILGVAVGVVVLAELVAEVLR